MREQPEAREVDAPMHLTHDTRDQLLANRKKLGRLKDVPPWGVLLVEAVVVVITAMIEDDTIAESYRRAQDLVIRRAQSKTDARTRF